MQAGKLAFVLLLLLLPFWAGAQGSGIEGKVLAAEDGLPLSYSVVVIAGTEAGTVADSAGVFRFTGLEAGNYTLVAHSVGRLRDSFQVQVKANETTQVTLRAKLQDDNGPVVITGQVFTGGMTRLQGVVGTAIYEGKKNEVIILSDINANLATNNPRQVFAKVPGVNIIENDCAGIQLGVAVRGLNPNRISEFNARQNGYDIAADALGYPESYYTPPTEALERIEVVRGAASLQYGSQFGGLLNFVFKKGADNKPVEIVSRQTYGSFGLFNSFNSIGGSKGNWRYYGFIHHKQGDGFRANSGFNINTAYSSVEYQASKKLLIGAEMTAMHYEMQQPGGLTDAQFATNPRQATRSRNWFSATWFIPALKFDYEINKNTRINWRTFGLVASRAALGNLIAPTQPDYRPNRNLMLDNYRNIGSELRFLHQYKLGKQTSTFLAGARYYRGNTHRRQGLGSEGTDADFDFLNPEALEGSDFRFPSTNVAVFSENIFKLSEKWTVTPGMRMEYIATHAKGYYMQENDRLHDTLISRRQFPLFGMGISYHPCCSTNFYLNFSQAYSGVNFNDIRVLNPNFRVDPNLKDVTGWNLDLGYRGQTKNNVLKWDIGAFYLAYNDRIGVLTMADEDFNIYRYRTNIADSRSIGVESFVEFEVFKALKLNEKWGNFSIYNTLAFTDARYINTPVKAVMNKRVEYAPARMTRIGTTWRKGGFSSTLQYSYVSEQYTDATNTAFTVTGVNGRIPAYSLLDLSLGYKWKRFELSGSVNNLLNQMYFTRRADGYPGPGILPSDGRAFFVTAAVKI